MAEDLSRLVKERLATAMAVPVESLTRDTELGDEIWEDEVIEPLCEELGLDPAVVFPPDEQPPRNALAVAGLRRLAPFSERSAARLKGMERRFEILTVGSLIRSLEERRHVGSGRFEVLEDRPLAPGRAVARLVGWTAGIAAALSLGAWADCNPACRACLELPEVATGLGLPVAVAIVGGWHVLALGAAALELARAPVAMSRA